VLFMWGSIGLYFAFIFSYQYVDVVYNFKHIANQMSSMPTFWFIVILVPTLTVTLELGLRMVSLYPSFSAILTEYYNLILLLCYVMLFVAPEGVCPYVGRLWCRV
jgi:hypothetical protein